MCHAQFLYIEQYESLTDVETYHNDARCPYFIGYKLESTEISLTQAQKLHLKECPYCYQGKVFSKSQKIYVPRYNTSFTTQNLMTKASETFASNTLQAQKEIMGGKVKVTVVHELVTVKKIKDIVDAHEAQNAAKIATIASLVTSGASLFGGSYLSSYVNLLQAQNCSALVQFENAFSQTAESLAIFVILENFSEHEIKVSDEKQGKTYHILPGSYIVFSSYDKFNGVIRVEDEFAVSKDIEYVNFNTANQLLKIRPYQIDMEHFYIKCPDVNTFADHYIEADEIKKDLKSYKVNRENFVYEEVDE